MTKRTVLCHAHGRPGDWEAICFDFDIAVQGQSFEQVKSLLDAAVSSYVVDACAEDEQTAKRLLSRRAPLSVRLRLLASYAAHVLLRRNDEREYQAGFDIPCHA